MTTAGVICPVCRVPPAPHSAACPDCGENLAVLVHLRVRPGILYNEGLCLARAGETSRAIAVLERAVAEDSDQAEALVVLGKLYAQQGATEEARAAFEQALARAPGHSGGQRALIELQKQVRAQMAAEVEAERERAAAQARAAGAARRRRLAELAGAFAVGVLAVASVRAWAPGSSSTRPAEPAIAGVQAPSPPVAIASDNPAQTATHAVVPPSADRAATGTAETTRGGAGAGSGVDLRQAVLDALQAQAELARYPLRVTQDGNTVRLSGEVPTLAIRFLAETAASAVPEVGTVDLRELVLAPAYEVQPGDSLWTIAARLLGSPDAWPSIARINDLAPPYALRPGQRLAMPAP